MTPDPEHRFLVNISYFSYIRKRGSISSHCMYRERAPLHRTGPAWESCRRNIYEIEAIEGVEHRREGRERVADRSKSCRLENSLARLQHFIRFFCKVLACCLPRLPKQYKQQYYWEAMDTSRSYTYRKHLLRKWGLVMTFILLL